MKINLKTTSLLVRLSNCKKTIARKQLQEKQLQEKQLQEKQFSSKQKYYNKTFESQFICKYFYHNFIIFQRN